jgi:hypothetical protein
LFPKTEKYCGKKSCFLKYKFLVSDTPPNILSLVLEVGFGVGSAMIVFLGAQKGKINNHA